MVGQGANTRMGDLDPSVTAGLRSRGVPRRGARAQHTPEGAIRAEVIRRLRHQVASGSYDAPVEDLVDRMVDLILARRAARGAGPR